MTTTFANFLAGMAAIAAVSGCGAPAARAPAVAAAAAPAAPAASAPGPVSTVPRYRCDQGIEFTVRFSDDTEVLDAGSRGNDVLLRDAGGATPQQTVYSNARMRAEFGLGAAGREALLRYAAPPLSVHCVQG